MALQFKDKQDGALVIKFHLTTGVVLIHGSLFSEWHRLHFEGMKARVDTLEHTTGGAGSYEISDDIAHTENESSSLEITDISLSECSETQTSRSTIITELKSASTPVRQHRDSTLYSGDDGVFDSLPSVTLPTIVNMLKLRCWIPHHQWLKNKKPHRSRG